MTALEVLALSIAWYFLVVFVMLLIVIKKINRLLKPQTDPQKPKDIRKLHYDGYVGNCPSCDRIVRFAQRHCHNCIQLLDWSEVLTFPTEKDDD